MTLSGKTCSIAIPRGQFVEYERFTYHKTKKEAKYWLNAMREINVMTNKHKVFQCESCKGFHIKKKK